MKKYIFAVLVVMLVCTSLTACSKEIDTVTESVNEKESSVTENPTVLEDTMEIVFPEQFETLSGYDEEALVDYLKKTVKEIIRKSNVLMDRFIWLPLRKKLVVGGDLMNEEVSYTEEDWKKTF